MFHWRRWLLISQDLVGTRAYYNHLWKQLHWLWYFSRFVRYFSHIYWNAKVRNSAGEALSVFPFILTFTAELQHISCFFILPVESFATIKKENSDSSRPQVLVPTKKLPSEKLRSRRVKKLQLPWRNFSSHLDFILYFFHFYTYDNCLDQTNKKYFACLQKYWSDEQIEGRN